MEEQRLKPMSENYDKALFNSLYQQTEKLRNKLAHNIDNNRFKVDKDEIKSWLDIKFIFVFNKYYGKMDNETLKGHIIKALMIYQYKIMRRSYSPKWNMQNHINFEDRESLVPIVGADIKEETLFKESAIAYMKKNLPPEAYTILQIDLYPPYYIIRKLQEENINNIQKIPARIISEYLGWENPTRVNKFRNLIKKVITEANEYFETNPIIPEALSLS